MDKDQGIQSVTLTPKATPWLLDTTSPMHGYALDKLLGLNPLVRVKLEATQRQLDKMRENNERTD